MGNHSEKEGNLTPSDAKGERLGERGVRTEVQQRGYGEGGFVGSHEVYGQFM